MNDGINVNEKDILFTNFITGIRGIKYNTIVLIANNEPEQALELIYNTTNDVKDNQIIKIPFSSISNISVSTKVGIQNTIHKTEENETKGMLLSALLLGGNPVLQGIGNSAIPGVLNTLSNNYDKVNYDSYYELIIQTVINGEETKLMFNTEKNPEEFFKDKINK